MGVEAGPFVAKNRNKLKHLKCGAIEGC